MIQVIKEVRALTGLGLKEAKNLVDDAPATVLRVPDVAMAQAARTILESAGATVSITDPAS
jgi:large subunit ribosomal protein L7/L12